MDADLLDGWLALAAETKRVDRLSSSLGLDSPALQNSPSSLGSSSGSPGLNTPSQNAFRFLPFLNDFSPELLKSSSLKLGQHSPLSRERPHSYLGPFPSRAQRRSGPVHSPESSMPPDWRKRKSATQSITSPKVFPVPKPRPSLNSGRHVSYPSWPSPKPAPLTISLPLRLNERHSRGEVEMDVPSLRVSRNEPTVTYGRRNAEPQFPPGLQIGRMVNVPVSPMLSEPFDRLIVKDEDEFIDLSADPTISDGVHMDEDGEMKTVPEEEEDVTNWWENDSMRDFTFEFDAAPVLPPFATRTLPHDPDQPSRPWAIPK